MEEFSPKILIVSGEASGDMYAAALAEEIRKKLPSARMFGLGGEKSRLAGIELIEDLASISVVGFTEVLKNLRKFMRIFDKTISICAACRPDAAILIDYPGFNLRLAARLKKLGIPVIYYVSPQIWAWGGKRIKNIRRDIDLMIVLFKFEEDLYRNAGVPVFFAGHPLLDIVKTTEERKQEFRRRYGVREDIPAIAVLPGSRKKEIGNLLKPMLQTCVILKRLLNGKAQFILLQAPGITSAALNEQTRKYPLNIKIIPDFNYEALETSRFALVASGTATLETAISGTPMAILYKVSLPTWLMLRTMVKIRYAGIINIIKNREISKEFLQYKLKPERIAEYAHEIISNEGLRDSIKKDLLSVKEALGKGEAIKKAAEAITAFLKTRTAGKYEN